MSGATTTPKSATLPTEMPAATASRGARGGWLVKLLGGLPALVIFGLLAGIFWLGHHTGWQLPKMSALWGAPAAATDDWCSEHLVPESICVECQPGLDPKGKEVGFCRLHGVAECVICHPELAQVSDAPRLPQYDTVAAINLRDRPQNNSRSTLHKSRVQFASLDAFERAGVEVDVVTEHPVVEAITANGELVFDPTRVAHLSSKVPGTVARVFKIVGDEVQPGDVLALVDAAQVGQAKSQLLQAVVQLQLKKTNYERLREAGAVVTGRTVIEAESALQEAEVAMVSARQTMANLGFEVPEGLEGRQTTEIADQLRFLGVSEELTDELPPGAATANLIPVRAPYAGVVISADAVAGEVVDQAGVLFVVADPRSLWLMLHVGSQDARYLKPGLPVEFQTDDRSQTTEGQISWISPTVDQQTRTLHVRVSVDNADGKLRDKTFGSGRIILRREQHAVVVPASAVQATADAHYVFVRDKRYFQPDAPKLFHVRQVRIGAQDDQTTELLAGVLPGEVVAAKGSNVLLAQLLRSNLGAGCGCHEK